MKENNESKIPVGYVRVNQSVDVPSGRVLLRCTKWNEKEWESYEPADLEEFDDFVRSKQTSSGQIVNLH